MLLLAYVAAVTYVARFETSGAEVNKRLPFGVLLGMGFVFLATTGSWLAAGPFFGLSALAAYRVSLNSKHVTPAEIGAYIRLLLPIQAGLCASSGTAGILVGALLLVLWPISRLAGRGFYAS